MVSAFLVDALRDPTAELQELYSSSSSEDFPSEVTKHFSNVFRKAEAFNEIPTLSVHNPPEAYPDRSLVRFRAMVQDTSPSAEMYLCKTRSGACGGWGIEEHPDTEQSGNMDYANLRECTVLWAVNVPGESEWCAEELDDEHPPQASIMHNSKRAYKHPGRHNAHIGVQVKLYDGDRAQSLKSTDIATFIGILTSEPVNVESEELIEVPTLHVLFFLDHPHGLVSRSYPYKGESERTNDPSAKIREELIDWIAEEALGGDKESAEWVLLACIARVQSRSPPLIPPSITISHFPSPTVPSTTSSEESPPPTYNPTLSTLLSLIFPLTSTMPLSLPLLNSLPFSPESKNEDLHSGALQLPAGTVLLVTESGVREGKLIERGVMNVHALQQIMSSQTLAYIFPFSEFSFPTDISCMVLSEGKKSAFFKTDITVPLQLKTSTAIAEADLYKPQSNIKMPAVEKLTAFRDLVVGAQCGKISVSESTSDHIQQEFVRERQKDKSITSGDLIRRMTVAKLYALSLHVTELTIDVWERAKAFDERRKARLA